MSCDTAFEPKRVQVTPLLSLVYARITATLTALCIAETSLLNVNEKLNQLI